MFINLPTSSSTTSIVHSLRSLRSHNKIFKIFKSKVKTEKLGLQAAENQFFIFFKSLGYLVFGTVQTLHSYMKWKCKSVSNALQLHYNHHIYVFYPESQFKSLLSTPASCTSQSFISNLTTTQVFLYATHYSSADWYMPTVLKTDIFQPLNSLLGRSQRCSDAMTSYNIT